MLVYTSGNHVHKAIWLRRGLVKHDLRWGSYRFRKSLKIKDTLSYDKDIKEDTTEDAVIRAYGEPTYAMWSYVVVTDASFIYADTKDIIFKDGKVTKTLSNWLSQQFSKNSILSYGKEQTDK